MRITLTPSQSRVMPKSLVNSDTDRLENDQAYLSTLRHDMLRFARIQLRDVHLAEDVVQEALAAALSGKREFEGRSALKTWVFAILRNKIVDAIRVRSRSVNVSALADEEAGLDEASNPCSNPMPTGTPRQGRATGAIPRRPCARTSSGSSSTPA